MDDGLLIGLDIGGTKMLAAAATSAGEVLRTERADTPYDGGEGFRTLEGMIARVLEGKNPLAVGVSAGGPLQYKTGIISPLHQPGWKAFPVGDEITRVYGVSWRIEVDTDAGVLAEHRFGGGASDRLLYLTLSTGLGGGFLVDGQIYRGFDGAHPEVGHQSIPFRVKNPAGVRCACGAPDCLEALCSGRGIERIYGKPAADLDDDEWAEVAFNLGLGLRNLAAIYTPRLITLGGGVAVGGGQKLIDHAAATMRSRLNIVPDPEVRLSSLGYNTALLGAVALAQDAAGRPRPGSTQTK